MAGLMQLRAPVLATPTSVRSRRQAAVSRVPCARVVASGSSPRPVNAETRRRDVRMRAIKEPQVDEEVEMMRKKQVGPGDIASLWITNILQTYGDAPSADGAPVAEGVLDDLVGRPLFLALKDYFAKAGGVYKLAFGPKTFMVLSDPVVVRHVLRNAYLSFDKGILAEILEPIMGKGLIPADFETWKTRRRAIVPGFHQAWLNHMVGLFGDCTKVLTDKLAAESKAGTVLDMENLFCSVSLDIIGLSVFNYPFGSVTKESPVIQAVYNTLREAEHRSTFYFPYWNLPLASVLVPRQRAFQADLKIINDKLNELIALAQNTKTLTDLKELENREYDKVKDPSLLRFLVDLRGETTTNAQLRDDLMTMLVAGHETTAAVLTWALYEIAQNPEYLAKLRTELDEVLPDGRQPDYEDCRKLTRTRLVVAESLRMYPQPPVLLRRALEEVPLPKGLTNAEVKIVKGMDVIISVYNLHRHPDLWDEPDKFNPDRFLTATPPNEAAGWEGRQAYEPVSGPMSPLYPNETMADFAYVPFGGGSRKCVGDQFAVLESTVVLAMVLQRFDFEFAIPPETVGMTTGATIHTSSGLKMRVKPRAGWTPKASN